MRDILMHSVDYCENSSDVYNINVSKLIHSRDGQYSNTRLKIFAYLRMYSRYILYSVYIFTIQFSVFKYILKQQTQW